MLRELGAWSAFQRLQVRLRNQTCCTKGCTENTRNAQHMECVLESLIGAQKAQRCCSEGVTVKCTYVIITDWGAWVAMQAQGLPWTALLDAGLAAASAEAGAQPADVLAACRRVPFHAAMQQVGASARTSHQQMTLHSPGSSPR